MKVFPCGITGWGKKPGKTRHWRLTPVILAIQEAEIRRIVVQSQSWTNSFQETLSQKYPTKNRAGGVAQV
jgi:hypothetical protein